MTKIVISYSRKSEAVAKSLAGDIEKLGYIAWFDQELSGGQKWWDHILATIRDCDIFIFLLDKESLNSTACKREYSYAADLGKSILPVLVSGGISINLLPPSLSQIQYVDYQKQDRDTAFQLARALNNVPPSKPLPDPLPTMPEIPMSYLGGLAKIVENTDTLSYEKQSVLLVDLKRNLRDGGTSDDTRTLLERMRRRYDLFATIAEEIDELLDSTTLASTDDSEKNPLSSEQLQNNETQSTMYETKPPKKKKSQGLIRAEENLKLEDTEGKDTTLDEYFLILVVVVVVLSLLAFFFGST